MRGISRRFWGTIFTLIIAIAVLLQLGREAFPLLTDFKDEIAETLSETLGVKLTIGKMSAQWKGLTPKLELADLAITSDLETGKFTIKRASAELSLVDSIVQWNFAWRRIVLDELEIELQQDAQGHWQIAGLPTPTSTENEFVIDDPLDVFLFGRRVEIRNSKVGFHFRTGHRAQVVFPVLDLENDKDFHRLQAEMEVDDDQKAFTFVVEGYGDPRSPDDFNSSGYLELKQFPMEKVLAAVAGQFWQNQEQQQWREGHRMDLSLWYQGTSSKGIQFVGKMRADGLPLKLPENVSLPRQIYSDITGSWKRRQDWQLQLQKLNIQWLENSAPELNLKLYGKRGKQIGIATENIDLGEWQQVLASIGIDNTNAGKTFAGLRPGGKLKSMVAQLTEKDKGFFDLTANIENGSMESYRGAPEISHINGYIKANAFGGYINLQSQNGLKLQIPKIYDNPFEFQSASGQVRWRLKPEEKIAYISSGLLTATSEQLEATGYLYLKLPYNKEIGEPEMTLAIGSKYGLAADYHKYLPNVVPEQLSNWLERSQLSGQLSEIAFVYHGSVEKQPKYKPSILLHANVREGHINFDPEWPRLTKLNGALTVENEDVIVDIDNAELAGNKIEQTTVTLEHNLPDTGRVLAIDGNIAGKTESIMKFLLTSPIKKVLGSAFDAWQYTGDVSAKVDLRVPLSEDSNEQSQRIQATLHDVNLNMADVNLEINQINGKLNYSHEKGLTSNLLTGTLWNEELSANISSELEQGTEKIQINYQTEVPVKELAHWTERPELQFLEGAAAVKGSVAIPIRSNNQPLRIENNSDLVGIEINLPEPFGKSADEAKQFSLAIDIEGNKQEYSLATEPSVVLTFDRVQSLLTNMQLQIGEGVVQEQDGYFDIAGHLHQFDLDAWHQVRDRYFAYEDFIQTSAAQSKDQSFLPVRFNLNIDRGFYGDFTIEKLNVSGHGTKENWRLVLDSEVAKGNIDIANDDSPIAFKLNYLRIPQMNAPVSDKPENNDTLSDSSTEAETQTSFLEGIDINKIIPVDFYAGELKIGESDFGAWRFELRPIKPISADSEDKQPDSNSGLVLRNIHADTRKIKIGGGVTGDDAGAELIWLRDNGVSTSQFISTLSATNVADVSQAWGLEKFMETSRAEVQVAASWDGAPDQITLEKLNGLISLDFHNGNFIRGAGAGENPILRLMALFNFDTLARRLRLDFSDLAKEGFAFDRVYGDLNFEDGKVIMKEPLIVESTSSNMQMAGTINTIDEEVDTELVVTLPVGGNLAVATAFVAGLPAGIGVYVVSKLFREQVDKVSSISYAVSGDWDEPKIKVKGIFDEGAARKKGDALKTGEGTNQQKSTNGDQQKESLTQSQD